MTKIILIALFFLQACSFTQKVALRSSSDVFENGARRFENISTWEQVEKSMGANLLFLESLLETDPSNQTLISQLIKGYSGYAFAVYETLLLEEELSENENQNYRVLSQYYYKKALDLSSIYFKQNKLPFDKLIALTNTPEKITELLKQTFTKDDYIAVFFTAQAWAGLINLNRSNTSMAAHLSVAKTLADWVCQSKPSFEYYSCDLFYGIYELSRPKMLGGNPDKGRSIFKKMEKANPYNLLIPVMYLQWSTIPNQDKNEFNQIAKKIEQEEKLFIKSLTNPSYLNLPNPYNKVDHLNLFNAIALKKFSIMKKYQKKIF